MNRERWGPAVRMFKRFARLMPGGDVSHYLFQTYTKLGKHDKARTSLLTMASSPMGFFRVAQAHLDGDLEFRIAPLLGNLSVAVERNSSFFWPALALAPRIVVACARWMVACASGECGWEDMEAMKVTLARLLAHSAYALVELTVCIVLIILLRRRAALRCDCT
jgi:hypothetical protein